jgi:hypothetical protein
MSLPPDVKKKLDGWLLELDFAVNSGLNLSTLAVLRDLLKRVRYEDDADANALLGLKKLRGRQVDYARQRMWHLYLSWIEAMRSLGLYDEKRTLPQFYEDIIHADAQGWLKLKNDAYSFDPSVLDKNLAKFRAVGGSAQFIMERGLLEDEQAAVRHLQDKYGLTLWVVDALGNAPERGTPAYLWSLEPPKGWSPAELEWTEQY